MHVLATAGHVDHGKSALVRALTGMEPDRWAQERERGMTIDLGYAWTPLPSGATVAFVDVPGHQRFLGNTLAGLGPAPAVVLVVAADEGWRRQSGEHLAALDALQVRHGLLVVTRSDLADPGPATSQALEHLRASSLGDVAAVQVSSTTGQGIPALRVALDDLLTQLPRPDPDADVRLWVDRAFTVRGSGTVVTGTLTAGTLRVGDELVLRGERVRVRGLQSLGQAVDEVAPVARVAVNLRGVDVDQVGRGDALLTPQRWLLTSELDVRVSGPTHEEVVLHLGTAAVPVHVRRLDERTARLRLAHPLPLRAGDRGVLRDPGAQGVAAGVHVLDADPPPLQRRGAARARAAVLAEPLGLRAEVARRGWVRASHLSALGLDAELDSGLDDGPESAAATGLVRHGGWLADVTHWDASRARLESAVRAVPPEQGGLPHEAARQAAGLPDPALLAPLARVAGLALDAGRVRAPSQGLGAAEAGVTALERHLAQRPFDAPERDVLRRLRLDATALAAAERAGRLLRLGPDVVVLPGAPELAVRRLSEVPQPFAVGAATRALGTSRRVAVPLLELLDRRGLTRRLADGTRVRVSPARPA